MITGLVALPLIIVAGVPIDLARQIELQTTLQNNADAAALAGASVLGETTASTDAPALVKNYMAASDAGLVAAVTVAAPTIAANSSVTVNVAATMPAVFTAWMKMNMPVTVLAQAGGPGEPRACATPIATSAADLNQIWIYAVTPSGTRDTSNLVELVDNAGSTYAAGTQYCQNEPLVLGERLAFELVNQTGARNAAFYNKTTTTNGKSTTVAGTNLYGAAVNALNDFYTSDYPTSLNTGSSTTSYDATDQESDVNASKVSFSNAAVLTVATSTTATTTITSPTACYVTPAGAVAAVTYAGGFGTLKLAAQQENVVVYNSSTATVGCGNNTVGSAFNLDASCLELDGGILTVDWNDMGGLTDTDLYGKVSNTQYTDMSYNYSCTGSAGSTVTNYSKVILVR